MQLSLWQSHSIDDHSGEVHLAEEFEICNKLFKLSGNLSGSISVIITGNRRLTFEQIIKQFHEWVIEHSLSPSGFKLFLLISFFQYFTLPILVIRFLCDD